MAQEKPTRTGTGNRGFASMDPAKQREIASKGGKAAHLAGTAHEFTPEEAREAGRKGGQASGGSRARAAARNLQAATENRAQSESMNRDGLNRTEQIPAQDIPMQKREDQGEHRQAS